MLYDAARDGDAGFGPYSVERNDDDAFYYVHRDGQPVGKGWALRKGALRKARELNEAYAAETKERWISTAEREGLIPARDSEPEDFIGENPSGYHDPEGGDFGGGDDPEPSNFERMAERELRALIEAGEIDGPEEGPGHIPTREGLEEQGFGDLLEPDETVTAEEIERFPSAERHEWLEDAGHYAAKLLRDRTDLEVPKAVRVSVGWPGLGRKAIGSCWHLKASGDGHREIFISPVLEDGVQIVATLIHEMIHASLPDDAKHGKLFGKPARAVGLEGKLTATYAGEELEGLIKAWVETRGQYPAKGLLKSLGAEKKQTTRMLKVSCCREHEEYVVRMSRAQFERAAPICGICGEDMEVE